MTAISQPVSSVYEDFNVLPFSASIIWDMLYKQDPEAKTTANTSFILTPKNFKSGAKATFKVIITAATAVTISFAGSGLTYKVLNNILNSYTFPIGANKEYFIQLINDNGVIEVVIYDYSLPVGLLMAEVIKTTPTSTTTGTYTAVPFTSETFDNGNIYDITSPTRFTIPGSGSKRAGLFIQANWPTTTVTGKRIITVYKNGVLQTSMSNASASIAPNTFTQVANISLICAGGDYIEVYLFQDSGGAISCSQVYANITIQSLQ